MTYAVLFVCAGNVGRSPLAEAMAKRLLAEALDVEDNELESCGIRVLSAGTLAPDGIETSSRGVALAEEIGITMERHPARRLTGELADAVDVIFGMDGSHVEHLALMGYANKTELLNPDGLDIPDPRHQDWAFFRAVREQIGRALLARVPEILTAAGRD